MSYQKNILVRLFDADSEKEIIPIIKTYYTSDYSETLKMYQFMQVEEIPIKVPDDNDFGDKHNGNLMFITDIEVIFGSESSLVCIDIYASGGTS